MATVAAEAGRAPAVIEESLASRILRAVAKAPVHLLLLVVGVFWLVPTFGLFLTSLLSPADFSSEG
jgi:alpha-glucoside transport system permease protein